MSTARFSIVARVTLVAFSLVAAGCGAGADDEPVRTEVFGAVTVDGQPVQAGEIRFVPAEGTDAPTAGATITSGEYRVDHKGGVPVGTFQVRISAYRAPGTGQAGDIPGAPADDPMASREQYLPEKFSGEASELTLTVESASEPVRQDFDLQTVAAGTE